MLIAKVVVFRVLYSFCYKWETIVVFDFVYACKVVPNASKVCYFCCSISKYNSTFFSKFLKNIISPIFTKKLLGLTIYNFVQDFISIFSYTNPIKLYYIYLTTVLICLPFFKTSRFYCNLFNTIDISTNSINILRIHHLNNNYKTLLNTTL